MKTLIVTLIIIVAALVSTVIAMSTSSSITDVECRKKIGRVTSKYVIVNELHLNQFLGVKDMKWTLSEPFTNNNEPKSIKNIDWKFIFMQDTEQRLLNYDTLDYILVPKDIKESNKYDVMIEKNLAQKHRDKWSRLRVHFGNPSSPNNNSNSSNYEFIKAEEVEEKNLNVMVDDNKKPYTKEFPTTSPEFSIPAVLQTIQQARWDLQRIEN